MTSPITRPTLSDDIPALQRILEETMLFPRDLLPDMIAPFLARDPGGFWLTALFDDAPVGFCYTVPEELAEGTWNMLALAVVPNCQGNGVGAALVSAAERHLRDRNQRILIVDTSGDDEFALTRRFYAKNGYDEEARIRDFWAAGDDKVIFRKAL